MGGVVAGERRLLTVMFCDLVGSTAMSTRLDPEDYAEIVLTYQETARHVVETHGGLVAQFVGDGLVIEFGYPVAHENDAERAVESALAIRRALAEFSVTAAARFGIDIACRIGVHSDLTVVGRMGTDRGGDLALFGTTANVAARVQGEAAPGEIYLSDRTLALLGGRFTVDSQREAELRGVDEPIVIARLVGHATVTGDAPRAELVARHAERDRLAQRWADAQQGLGGAVQVVGPAGVGKSMLVDSLRGLIAPHDRVEVRARELTALTPFATLADLAARCSADPRLHIAALAVQTAIADAGRNAEHARQLVIERSRALGEELGRSGRLIVIEDVHWLDSSSRDAIAGLIGSLHGSTALLVTTSRDADAAHSGDTVMLGPLGHTDAAAVITSLADREGALPASVVDEIVSRSGGIPLYLVALAESAIAGRGTPLPASLQSSLLARLDRFPSIRRAAQVASVIGDPVDQGLLTMIVGSDAGMSGSHPGVASNDAPVNELIEAGVLVGTHDGPPVFSHALLREAVYESLLQRDRRRLHRQLADALEAAGGRDDDRVGLIAHHLEHADEPLPAAEAFAAAARRSARRGAAVEALALAERGLALLAGQPDTTAIELHLTMTKGNATFAVDGYGADGLLELWQAAERLAQQCGDRTELTSAMNGQSAAALFDGDYALSTERAERIVRFGREHDDRPALVRGHCSRGLAQLWAGDCAAALDDARRAIELYEPGDDQLLTYGFGTDHAVIALSAAGAAAWFVGDPDAETLAQQAIDHGERIESPISLCVALQQAAVIDLIARRFDAAVARSERLISTAERFSSVFFAELGRLTRATARAMCGDRDAFDDAMAALTGLMAGTSQLGVTMGLLHLALCQEAVGQRDGAAGTARYGLDVAADRSERVFEVELVWLHARCSDTDEAWAQLVDAADRADERGAHACAARARSAIAARTAHAPT